MALLTMPLYLLWLYSTSGELALLEVGDYTYYGSTYYGYTYYGHTPPQASSLFWKSETILTMALLTMPLYLLWLYSTLGELALLEV